MKVIEIKNVGFDNKGAELMLRTILQQLVDFKFVITPNERLVYHDFSHLRLSMRLDLPRNSFLTLEHICQFLPKKIRHRIGVVNFQEVDVILDCSGLAYSDDWGVADAIKCLSLFKKAKKKNKKIIMLPQAFGPFENLRLKNIMKQIFTLADKVYVRDQVSLTHCLSVVDRDYEVCPDFTNIYHKIDLEAEKNKNNVVTFVPNYRLVDKHGISVNDMVKYALIAKDMSSKNGLKFQVLINEEKDFELFNSAFSESGLNCYYSKNIEDLTRKLAESSFVISGRYHAAATALSCNVPTMCLAWSHKYLELLRIYGMEDYINDLDSFDNYKVQLQDLFSEFSERARHDILAHKNSQYRSITDEFFKNLRELINE